MDDERHEAAEALATVATHQHRARRAARLPWWFFGATFLVIAAGVASNDFVTLTGAKLLAGVVVVALVVALIARYTGGSALMSRVRGVQARSYDARASIVIVILGVIVGWLSARYGVTVAQHLADGIGLHRYPYTVAGVLAGALFTGVLALEQLISASYRPGR